MKPVLIWIGITLAGQVIGFSFWLGKLSQRVSSLSNDIPHIRDKIDELHGKVSHIEGRLRQRDENSEQ